MSSDVKPEIDDNSMDTGENKDRIKSKREFLVSPTQWRAPISGVDVTSFMHDGLSKIVCFDALLPRGLNGEQEYMVLGGIYKAKQVW